MAVDEIRKKLIDLGAENLAAALIKIAEQSDKGADFLGHLLATPDENIKRFKSKLHNLRTSTRYISWSESRHFAQELEALLEDLRAGVESPETGIELIAEFFKSDRDIFEQCDDSSGRVGDVFQNSGTELFGQFANHISDKTLILNQIKDLYGNDDYGVRISLIKNAHKFLSKECIEDLINDFQGEANKYENNSDEERHWQLGIMILAKQLKDGELYAKVRLHSNKHKINENDVS